MPKVTRLGSLLAFVVIMGDCSSGGSGTGPTPGGPAAVDSLVLSLDSLSITDGDTARLSAVPRDANGNPVTGVQLDWETSDPTVATVSSDGLVTAVALGTADISVSVLSASASRSGSSSSLPARAAAKPPRKVPVHSWPLVRITPAADTAYVGQLIDYQATITRKNGAPYPGPQQVLWGSGNSSIATITQAHGLATAVGPGSTRINAKVTVGPIIDYVFSVPLVVSSPCSSLFAVTSWDATVASAYEVFGDGNGQFYTTHVKQSSTATTHLTMKPHLANADTVQWEGFGAATTGTFTVKNHGEGQPGPNQVILDESGSGAQNNSFIDVTLSAHSTRILGQSACEYTLTYQDGADYTEYDSIEGSGTVGTPLGIAAVRSVPLRTKPASGWRLTATDSVPGMALADAQDQLFPGLDVDNDNYYVAVPAIPAALLSFYPDGTLGKGTFTYDLVAH